MKCRRYRQNEKLITIRSFRSHQFYSSKAADPESSDKLQVVEGPGLRKHGHKVLQLDDVWRQRLALVARYGPPG